MKNIIKELRVQRQLTQEELAGKLGISRPALSNIERGIFNPRYSIICKISSYFGKPVEQIFFEEAVLQAEQKEVL